MHRRRSSHLPLSFAFMRSRRVFRSLVFPQPFPQMSLSRKLKVSGFPIRALRGWRCMATELDQRVFSGGATTQLLNRSRIASRSDRVVLVSNRPPLIGVSDDDHVADALAPSPALSPESSTHLEMLAAAVRPPILALSPVTDRRSPLRGYPPEPLLDQAETRSSPTDLPRSA